MAAHRIVAVVVGAILAIVAFNLWPVVNNAVDEYAGFYIPSCATDTGSHFDKLYKGATVTELPATLDRNTYYITQNVHGGPGQDVVNASGECSLGAAAGTLVGATSSATAVVLYTEHGTQVNAVSGSSATTITSISNASYVQPQTMLQRFGGVNNLLLAVIPIISIAGMMVAAGSLVIQGARGTAIGRDITEAVVEIVVVVVILVVAVPFLEGVVDANQVVASGQYKVNSLFGSILTLLFAMVPVVFNALLISRAAFNIRSAFRTG